MFPDSGSASLSKDILVINLDQVPLEDIVEEKLLYFLTQSPPLGRNLLKRFHHPVERAVIEFSLKKYSGNQSKTANILGLNRNTLKKKIVSHKLNVKQIKQFLKESQNTPKNKIFLNSISDLNLFSVCLAKLEWADFQNKVPNNNILKRLCQPIEIKIIYRVLNHFNGNRFRASRLLGIHRNTLKKKLALMKFNKGMSV